MLHYNNMWEHDGNCGSLALVFFLQVGPKPRIMGQKFIFSGQIMKAYWGRELVAKNCDDVWLKGTFS